MRFQQRLGVYGSAYRSHVDVQKIQLVALYACFAVLRKMRSRTELRMRHGSMEDSNRFFETFLDIDWCRINFKYHIFSTDTTLGLKNLAYQKTLLPTSHFHHVSMNWWARQTWLPIPTYSEVERELNSFNGHLKIPSFKLFVEATKLPPSSDLRAQISEDHYGKICSADRPWILSSRDFTHQITQP